jgi:hypothetical protein
MFPGQSLGGNSASASGASGVGVAGMANSGSSNGSGASSAGASGNQSVGGAGASGSAQADSGQPGSGASASSQGAAGQSASGGASSGRGGSGQPGSNGAGGSSGSTGYASTAGNPLYPQGGSGDPGSGSPAGAALNRIALPDTAPRRASARPAPVRPGRQFAERDWTIFIECTDDAVVLPNRQKVPLASLPRRATDANPLRDTVSKMIERRQSFVPAGEPPYRPRICFLVRPEGLRTYYLAYPALEMLQLPMTRQEVRVEEEPKH